MLIFCKLQLTLFESVIAKYPNYTLSSARLRDGHARTFGEHETHCYSRLISEADWLIFRIRPRRRHWRIRASARHAIYRWYLSPIHSVVSRSEWDRIYLDTALTNGNTRHFSSLVGNIIDKCRRRECFIQAITGILATRVLAQKRIREKRNKN